MLYALRCRFRCLLPHKFARLSIWICIMLPEVHITMLIDFTINLSVPPTTAFLPRLRRGPLPLTWPRVAMPSRLRLSPLHVGRPIYKRGRLIRRPPFMISLLKFSSQLPCRRTTFLEYYLCHPNKGNIQSNK